MTSFLGVILARAGSKRLPKKNTMSFRFEKDIVELTVERCIANDLPVVLSTDIIKHLRRFKDMPGVRLMERPKYLCGDEVDPVDVVLDLLHSIEDFPEYIILMQPTSQTWNFGSLTWAMKKVERDETSGMFSVNPAYKPNGCFYIVRTADLIKQRTFFVENAWVYVMSWGESVDIDNLWDFRVAQAVVSRQVTGK